jgi:hypothetical protein
METAVLPGFSSLFILLNLVGLARLWLIVSPRLAECVTVSRPTLFEPDVP